MRLPNFCLSFSLCLFLRPPVRQTKFMAVFCVVCSFDVLSRLPNKNRIFRSLSRMLRSVAEKGFSFVDRISWHSNLLHNDESEYLMQHFSNTKNLSGKKLFITWGKWICYDTSMCKSPIDIHRFLHGRFQPDEHRKRFFIYIIWGRRNLAHLLTLVKVKSLNAALTPSLPQATCIINFCIKFQRFLL